MIKIRKHWDKLFVCVVVCSLSIILIREVEQNYSYETLAEAVDDLGLPTFIKDFPSKKQIRIKGIKRNRVYMIRGYISDYPALKSWILTCDEKSIRKHQELYEIALPEDHSKLKDMFIVPFYTDSRIQIDFRAIDPNGIPFEIIYLYDSIGNSQH